MKSLKKYVNLTDDFKKILQSFIRSHNSAQSLVQRAKIILELASCKSKYSVAKELKVDKKTFAKWCKRWNESYDALIEIANNPDTKARQLPKNVSEVLQDKPRSGAPPKFLPEQVVGIIKIACKPKDDSEEATSRWTHKEIAAKAVADNIVESISESSVLRFLNDAAIKPHKHQY